MDDNSTVRGIMKRSVIMIRRTLSLPQRSHDCFFPVEYTQKSAGDERKGPVPNNVRESAFQLTNRAILSSANFYIF